MGKSKKTRKRSGGRKSQKKKNNKKYDGTGISVITYNVCWECMAGVAADTKAKAYGKRCGSKKPNRCRLNVIDICTSNPHAFIALQEATPDLADSIIDKMKKLGNGNYSKVIKKYGNAYAVLIYNTDMFRKSGKNGFRSDNIIEVGRPYIAQKFINKKTKKSIIVASFHGPHTDKDWVKDYLYRVVSLKGKEKKPQILVMGDLNRGVKQDLKLKNPDVKMKVLNKGKYKTAYNLDSKANYSLAIDNIMISDNIKVIFGPETAGDKQNVLLPRNTKNKYTHTASDHRPLTAILSIC